MPRTWVEPVRGYPSYDFKSCASANSATPAYYKMYLYGCPFGQSGKRGSNPRPPPWQGGALPLSYFRVFKYQRYQCRLKDLNPRPSDYKSDALPTELSRLIYNAGEGT